MRSFFWPSGIVSGSLLVVFSRNHVVSKVGDILRFSSSVSASYKDACIAYNGVEIAHKNTNDMI
jgi:hypothetical protein